MDRIFSVPLKGGAYTEVYSAACLEEMEEGLAGYGGSVLAVADRNTEGYVPEGMPSLILEPGESEKNWHSVEMILEKALSLGMARDSVFIGIGGGVVLDMTAFAASLYMRGARTVLVPTTLLSAVDATLGGKTGIDYGGAKNIIGTFYPAESVVIAPQTLRTLPDREYRCGLGEVIKHAFLSHDRRLIGFLSENRDGMLARNDDLVFEMIRLSLEVKMDYITRDPEERKGIRSALNLGHTFGHALEALEGFSISHGEGVVWGMARAFDAGRLLGITPGGYADAALSLISDYGFDTGRRIPASSLDRFMEAISKDKKKKGGSVRFVLMAGQGEPVLRPLDEETVRSVVS